MGLVTNKELCQVYRGIAMKNVVRAQKTSQEQRPESPKLFQPGMRVNMQWMYLWWSLCNCIHSHARCELP